MAKITVTNQDFKKIRDLVEVFGSMRKEAFVAFLMLYFSCNEETARKMTSTFLKRGAFYQSKNKYSYWKVIKAAPDTIVDYQNLDVFEAYVELYRRVLEENYDENIDVHRNHGRLMIQVGKLDFPYDYIFAAKGQELYKIVKFDDNGYQKLEFADRSTDDNRKGTSVMIVVTSKVTPDPSSLKMKSDHRIALVRTSGKQVVCNITDMLEGSK